MVDVHVQVDMLVADGTEATADGDGDRDGDGDGNGDATGDTLVETGI